MLRTALSASIAGTDETKRKEANEMIVAYMYDIDDAVHTVRWNTGRLYTSAGQRMVASVWPTGIVIFRDLDRMIDGVLHSHWLGGPLDPNWVMREYDFNRYDGACLNEKTAREMRSMWSDDNDSF